MEKSNINEQAHTQYKQIKPLTRGFFNWLNLIFALLYEATRAACGFYRRAAQV